MTRELNGINAINNFYHEISDLKDKLSSNGINVNSISFHNAFNKFLSAKNKDKENE